MKGHLTGHEYSIVNKKVISKQIIILESSQRIYKIICHFLTDSSLLYIRGEK